MNEFVKYHAWRLGICCLTLWIGWQGIMFLLFTPPEWYFTPSPPLPSLFIWPQTRIPCGSISCSRVTEFTTSLSPEALRTFYQDKLAEQGWHLHCTVDRSLPLCLSFIHHPPKKMGASVDVFSRDHVGGQFWQTLVLFISTPNVHGEHLVHIEEQSTVAYPSIEPPQVAPHTLQATILGEWLAISATGTSFPLAFTKNDIFFHWPDPEITKHTLTGGPDEWFGTSVNYTWINATTLQFDMRRDTHTSYPELNCKLYPVSWQSACVLEEKQVQSGSLTKTKIIMTMDLTLDVRLDGKTLLLTTPDGQTQTFHRRPNEPPTLP